MNDKQDTAQFCTKNITPNLFIVESITLTESEKTGIIGKINHICELLSNVRRRLHGNPAIIELVMSPMQYNQLLPIDISNHLREIIPHDRIVFWNCENEYKIEARAFLK